MLVVREEVVIFNTNDTLTIKIWSNNMYINSKKESIWREFTEQPLTPQFNNKEIKLWWGLLNFDGKNFREESKKQLGKWFKKEFDDIIFKDLTKN